MRDSIRENEAIPKRTAGDSRECPRGHEPQALPQQGQVEPDITNPNTRKLTAFKSFGAKRLES
jgi:hypothetical protein